MLTRNDKCFFALSFYRQSVMEAFRGRTEADRVLGVRQAQYWWEQYMQRREESRKVG